MKDERKRTRCLRLGKALHEGYMPGDKGAATRTEYIFAAMVALDEFDRLISCGLIRGTDDAVAWGVGKWGEAVPGWVCRDLFSDQEQA